MGDLPTQYASQQAAAGVGNADACLIFIRPSPGDQELIRMPRSFCIGDERVHISRPGQRGLSTPHTQPATTDRGCLHVTYGSLAMAKQLPPLWVVLCMPSSQRFPLAVR